MISVALCTYNGVAFIREQLDSIACQEERPAEIVICDDGSTDGTLDVLQAFANESMIPVSIHRNTTPVGSTLNFRKAISLCRGTFIALCDQDDVWKPNHLSGKLKFFREPENKDVNVVFNNLQPVSEKLEPWDKTLWQLVYFTRSQQKMINGQQAMRVLVRRGNVVTGSSMLMRSSFVPDVIDKLQLAFHHLIHDGIIAVEAAKSNSLRCIPDVTVLYRQHSQQQKGLAWTSDQPSTSFSSLNDEIRLAKEHFHDLQLMEISKADLAYAAGRIKHLEKRKRLQGRGFISRLLPVIGELLSYHYKKYSNSFVMMPLRDLIRKKV